MVKWSVRDWWGKLTEKKQLKPEVRDMLLRLDSVYEQRPGDEQPERADSPAPDGERTSGTRSPDR